LDPVAGAGRGVGGAAAADAAAHDEKISVECLHG
jgi:hypothetical protein